MLQIFANPITAAVGSLAAAVLLTFLVREFARKYNFIARPTSDRWHRKPTAMLGGVAIFASTWVMYLLFVPATAESLLVLAGATFLFFLGLIDDVLSIKPYQKLIGQMIGAVMVVGLGLKLPLTGNEIADIWITIFWIVGITNAVNLLDNMDGLAAGISAIAAISLGLSFWANGQLAEALFMAVFVGSLLGFLVLNFNPASIFMGDCGSMFVGFVLSCSVLLNQVGGRSRGVVPILAVPILILFVPIFDTTLVTVIRKMWGRKASQGGRDHTSHRLVALGLSERSAVLMLYSFAAAAGILSLFISRLRTMQSLALITVFTIVLALIGVYLSKVKVYEETEEELAIRNNAVFAFLVNVSYKRRIFEVFLDAFLITLSYYVSFTLLYGPIEDTGNWQIFLTTLPVLIVVKLAAFLLVGVYRGLWRYTSIGDLITYAKAVAVGSVSSILALLLIYRFENMSRAVFVLDGLLLLTALAGSRMAFRVFRQLLPDAYRADGRNVLIYGAGDGGQMVLRELKNNPQWNYKPVGFIDDDPLKKDRVIDGLKVFTRNGTLADVCREKDVEEILISFREMPSETLDEIRRYCRDLNIDLKRAELKIEPIGFD